MPSYQSEGVNKKKLNFHMNSCTLGFALLKRQGVAKKKLSRLINKPSHFFCLCTFSFHPN